HYDMEAVLNAAAKNKVAMEHNAYPDRLDLSDRHLRMARERGVRIVINTDTHHTSHMEKLRFGVLQARRAWVTKDDVLNTLPADQFSRAMKKQWPGGAGEIEENAGETEVATSTEAQEVAALPARVATNSTLHPRILNPGAHYA